MIIKIIKKLNQRYLEFKNHPIGKDEPIYNIFRYSLFNIKSKFIREIEYPWIGSLKFIARKGDAGIVGNIYFGLYEFTESIFLLHFLEEQDIFFDIGANLGHYSLLASGIKRCQSLAIEPVPETFNQLKKQIELNNLIGLITPLHIGVADNIGTLNFSTDRGTMNRIVSNDYKNSVSIPIETVDSIAINNDIPTAIKIDVEGFEKHVLTGAFNVLENPKLKVLIVEVNNSGENYGIKDDDIFIHILDFGFKPYNYNPYSRNLAPIETYNKKSFNTIFIRDVIFVQKRLNKCVKIKIRNQAI
jgi:FkbM family methyltransferase